MGIVLAILLFRIHRFFYMNWDIFFWRGLMESMCMNSGSEWGPTLAHKTIGNTDYCLKILPIGGACVMGEDEKEDLSEGSFNSKFAVAQDLGHCRRSGI